MQMKIFIVRKQFILYICLTLKIAYNISSPIENRINQSI